MEGQSKWKEFKVVEEEKYINNGEGQNESVGNGKEDGKNTRIFIRVRMNRKCIF